MALPEKKVKTTVPIVKDHQSFQYTNKIKSALYAFILFIILSHKVAYKVLDLILKVFTSKIEIINDEENPQLLGTLIMAFIVGLVIFVF